MAPPCDVAVLVREAIPSEIAQVAVSLVVELPCPGKVLKAHPGVGVQRVAVAHRHRGTAGPLRVLPRRLLILEAAGHRAVQTVRPSLLTANQRQRPPRPCLILIVSNGGSYVPVRSSRSLDSV